MITPVLLGRRILGVWFVFDPIAKRTRWGLTLQEAMRSAGVL